MTSLPRRGAGRRRPSASIAASPIVTVAAGQLHTAPGVAEHGEADRGLAGARLADQAEHLARGDRQVDVVDDVVAAAGHLDAQVR